MLRLHFCQLIQTVKCCTCCNGTTRRNKVICHDNSRHLYIAQGLQGLLDEARCQFVDVQEDQLLDSIDDSTAVIMVTEVNFAVVNGWTLSR